MIGGRQISSAAARSRSAASRSGPSPRRAEICGEELLEGRRRAGRTKRTWTAPEQIATRSSCSRLAEVAVEARVVRVASLPDRRSAVGAPSATCGARKSDRDVGRLAVVLAQRRPPARRSAEVAAAAARRGAVVLRRRGAADACVLPHRVDHAGRPALAGRGRLRPGAGGLLRSARSTPALASAASSARTTSSPCRSRSPPSTTRAATRRLASTRPGVARSSPPGGRAAPGAAARRRRLLADQRRRASRRRPRSA